MDNTRAANFNHNSWGHGVTSPLQKYYNNKKRFEKAFLIFLQCWHQNQFLKTYRNYHNKYNFIYDDWGIEIQFILKSFVRCITA